jgi:predicted permease
MTEILLAFRRLRQQPGFALAAVLMLGLCLGANLTVFAVVDSALLQPLPFAGGERLVTIYNSYPKAGLDRANASIRNYFTRRENIAAFESVSEIQPGSEVVGVGAEHERHDVLRVTPEFFATLGSAPVLGRSFLDQEMTPQADASVVISDRYWRQHLAADPAVLGRDIEIGGQRKAVVGVLPPGFHYLSSAAQLYLPLVSNAEQRSLNALHSEEAQMIARLKPGVSIAQAQAQVEADNALQSRGYPWAAEVAAAGFQVKVVDLHADQVASIRPILLLLQTGALGLLVIGAVNLLNLLLVRATARNKEMGVRRALGAAGRQLLQQVLTESLVLCLLGAALGLAVAAAGISLLDWLGASQLPLVAGVKINARLIGAALSGALLISLLIALPIAWFTLRQSLATTLKSESRGGSADVATQRWRHAFIVVQIALAFVLLSSAGLLGLSLQRAMASAPGFRAEQLLTARLSLPQANYGDADARTRFAMRALEQLAHQAGVVTTALSTNLPVMGRDSFNDSNAMTIPGYQPPAGVSPRLHYRYGVFGDYFQALGISLQAGRFLNSDDSAGDQRVCVVDEDFAHYYWPAGQAIGQRVFEGPDARADDQAFTVVGVVGAVRQKELTDTHGNGAIYFPYRHLANSAVYLITRSAQAPETMAPVLRTALREIDPQLALDQVKSMDSRIADTLLTRRSPALMASLFSALALVLAGLGSFAVLSYAVAQQRREIAVRMALGARAAQIQRHFLGLGLRLLLFGAALGVLGAWLAGTAMQSVLFAVPSLEPVSLLATAAVLGVVTLAACLVPALRAAQISPLAVLADQ